VPSRRSPAIDQSYEAEKIADLPGNPCAEQTLHACIAMGKVEAGFYIQVAKVSLGRTVAADTELPIATGRRAIEEGFQSGA